MALYHTTKGSVDYTVVGSPTISNGVVSGFNGYPNPACLLLPETADFSKPFHIHIEFTPTVINFGVIIGRTGSLKSGVYLQGIYSDYCRFALYNSSSTPAILDQNIAYDSAVVTGNKHALDIIYNGTDTYSIKLKNMISSVVLVNSSITTEAGAGSNAGFTLGATKSDTYYVPFQGSIDLNNTYIKVNEQPWFGLCPVEVKKHQLMGPVGYTKVGSPTIVDGVASGFSASDYLKINNNFSSSSNFEIVVRGTAIYAAAQRACLAFNNGENGFLDIGSGSSGIRLALKYNGSLTSFRIYPNLIEGQLYYIHIIKTNSTLTLGYSTDGKNILLSEDFSLTSFDWIFSYILLGMAPWQNATSYGGSIYLNETYIKVNGKLWFWQPQKSKYIVKDGKLVWADTHIYIDDNGTKTYATQNIAPVPSGYTFGNTTTPSIGYVDMRTQQFTAAPQGATIGRNE